MAAPSQTYREQAKANAKGVYARAQRLVDRAISPDTRQRFYSNVSTFAQEQPYLATFIALQLLLSFTPLLLFASFTIGLLALSLISALLFSLFWIGIALLLLIPTLFITVSLAIGLWIWGVASFVVARWVYNVLPFVVRGNVQAEKKDVNGSGNGVSVWKEGEGLGSVGGEIRGSG